MYTKALKINTNILNITNSEVTISASIVETDIGALARNIDATLYTWKCVVEPLDVASGKISSVFDIQATTVRCTISGLRSGYSYKITIYATERAGVRQSGSSGILVTAAFPVNHEVLTAQHPVSAMKNAIRRAFVRVGNSYRPVIMRNNIKGG